MINLVWIQQSKGACRGKKCRGSGERLAAKAEGNPLWIRRRTLHPILRGNGLVSFASNGWIHETGGNIAGDPPPPPRPPSRFFGFACVVRRSIARNVVYKTCVPQPAIPSSCIRACWYKPPGIAPRGNTGTEARDRGKKRRHTVAAEKIPEKK